jgi:hypothetical protein
MRLQLRDQLGLQRSQLAFAVGLVWVCEPRFLFLVAARD